MVTLTTLGLLTGYLNNQNYKTMKRILRKVASVLLLLATNVLLSQPVNTPDYPLTVEADIDQYNPSVFVNPLNSEEVIISAVRWNHTAIPGGYAYAMQPADFFQSQNGGNVWNHYSLPDKASASLPPVVQMDHTGRQYVLYGDPDKTIRIAWSDNQGALWYQKVLKLAPTALAHFTQYSNLWVDNSQRSLHKGNIYAVWQMNGTSAETVLVEFSKSDFGSNEWTNTINISANEPTGGAIEAWPAIATGPSGEIYVCWMNQLQGQGLTERSIGFNYSFDGGNTFGVSQVILNNIRGLKDYGSQSGIALSSPPAMAVDVSGGPDDGTIYIAWANIGVPGINTGQNVDIYMIKSADKGVTWSAPMQINPDLPGNPHEHFMPAITCDPETGTVAIIWYDNKIPVAPWEKFISIWGAVSYDGGASFSSFPVSDTDMNLANLITAYGSSYVSDRISVTAAKGKVYPVWADFRDGFCRTYTSPFDEKPVAKPENLVATITNTETGIVNLSWNMTNPTGVIHYKIYRNNQLITTNAETSYEEYLPGKGNFSYRVTAQFAEIESAPATSFISWGESELSVNYEEFNIKIKPGNLTTYVLKLDNQGSLPVDYTLTLQHSNEAIPTKGGGPDNFGYYWLDSNNPAGPGFDYIDISSSGTLITGIQNDNYVGPFPMGFSFPFYENYFDEFYISSNGLITFGGSFANPVNSPIPIADGNNNFIAWCWDDLQQKTGGQVFYKHFDQYTIIQFKDYAQNGIGANVRYVINAQVILYKNGDIKIQYLDRSTLFNTLSCTIGIENSTGTDGLQVVYNGPYIENNLAVRFFNPGIKWMNISRNHGTVDPASENLIFTTFKSFDMPVGEYFAKMVFKTNATANSGIIIPVKFEVTNNAPERPDSLYYEISGSDLELFWMPPTNKELLGYNIYERGMKINELLIENTNYVVANIAPGEYYYQVTALYSSGESNPEGAPMYVVISVEAEQLLELPAGWSGFSSFIEPWNSNLEALLSPIGSNLVIVSNHSGIYWPAQNVNTLVNWNGNDGYRIKLTQPHNLTVSGTVKANPVLSYNAGWKMMPVLTSDLVAPESIFESGSENLVILKEVAGTKVYWPAYGISTLEYLMPGKAYEMLLNGNAIVNFAIGGGGKGNTTYSSYKLYSPWNDPVQTGASHIIGISDESAAGLTVGDIIGVFDEQNRCAGIMEWQGKPMAITVFADDETTLEPDGMIENAAMYFKLYRKTENLMCDLAVDFDIEQPNQGLFTVNGISAITGIKLVNTGIGDVNPVQFTLFPNPAKDVIYLQTANISGSDKVTIFDTFGRNHGEIINIDAISPQKIDVSHLAPGVYFMRLEGANGSAIQKFILAK